MPTQADSRRSILDAGQRTVAHKGWAAVGLTEILTVAGVPKGSFYYYFDSKDAFGEAMLGEYFTEYLAEMDEIFAQTDLDAGTRLMQYWESWRSTQSLDDCQGKCLAVKLGAEVADLSETLRLALKNGTTGITDRIQSLIDMGLDDGSVSIDSAADVTAQTLYNLWLGASVMAKIQRDISPMDSALALTRHLLQR
ncbi:TetR/AcrR family transcriptional regulator [Glaciibacter psychrotolerans]|uniref:TetR/AcrR family transcriptional repressor of nem operon n=1 Tax=Glaciibacter psychrotolerans TaxID=670054 RepID=A0A7Z0EBP8_9MICO|nr:TetR/AcrR family transcriptional regulator [Leifsonia psychrotolerans]NYJ18568.1 TetR/AcrR family transcriptional repressor of nem operon [Leifsonia psychrotolerans]